MDNPKDQADALKKLESAFSQTNDLFRVAPRAAASPDLDKPAAGKAPASDTEDEGPTNKPDKARTRIGAAAQRSALDKGDKPQDVNPGGRSSPFSPSSGETAYFKKAKALVARRGELIVSKHLEGDIRCMVATRSTLAALGQLERVQAQDLAASDVAALEAELVAGEDLLDIE